MDIPTLLNNLHDEVSCPVCQDIFTDPRQLSCLHSFCLKCLQQWHRETGTENVIRCPKCQTLSTIPASGNLKDLPTSFYLNGFIDVLTIKECNTTQVTCRNCNKKSSEASYCFQCCKFYCEQCLIGHNMMLDYKEHRVLAVKAFQDKDYEDVLKRPAFCSKKGHEREQLRFFCKNCKTAACPTCFALEHSGHALVLIKDEAEQQRTEMRKTVETHKQNLQAKKNTIKQLNDGKTKLRQQCEHVKRHVETFIGSLIEVLVRKKQNIIEGVESQTKQSVDNLSAQIVKIENEIKEIETSLEKAEKLLTRTTDIEVVNVGLKASLQQIFEGSVQNKPDSSYSGSLPTITFVNNGKLMEAIKREKIGSLRICHSSKQAIPFQFKPVFDSPVGMFNCPWGVAVSDTDEIAVTDSGNHRVQIFDSSGKYLRSFGVRGTDQGEFNYPYGICFDNNSNIFVADHSNSRIQIFTREGWYKGMFDGKGSLDSQLSYPWGLSLDANGDIIVADSANKLIKIFTTDGKFVRKIGEPGCLSSPVHCVQCGEYFIVSDADDHCIKVFSREGKFQYEFGQRGNGDGEFNDPRCLSVTKSKHLMVCDRDNDRIQIFELNGRFVGKVGTKGSNIGELHGPMSVAVLNDVRIVVCEWWNNRIQIFVSFSQ